MILALHRLRFLQSEREGANQSREKLQIQNIQKIIGPLSLMISMLAKQSDCKRSKNLQWNNL